MPGPEAGSPEPGATKKVTGGLVGVGRVRDHARGTGSVAGAAGGFPFVARSDSAPDRYASGWEHVARLTWPGSVIRGAAGA
jgi:hypothetical protein